MTRRWRQIERELRATRGPNIAGVDEVGRGPLAGPVVACAVVMPPDLRAVPGVDDSKRLVATERVRLARLVLRRAVAVGVGAASVREIDRLNIYHATVLAMRRALGRLRVVPDHVLVDGKAIRTLAVRHTAIVGGDGCCYSIACASIVAKVTRDRLMHALAVRYPDYGWASNVGYATPAHLLGLAARGVTPHHRRSFIPVHQLSLAFGDPADFGPPTDEDSLADALDGVVSETPAFDALILDLTVPPFAPADQPPGIASHATLVCPEEPVARHQEVQDAGANGAVGRDPNRSESPSL